MQLSIDLKTEDIISLISQMSLNELEKVKNSLIERELYFKEFNKHNLVKKYKKAKKLFENDPFYPSLSTELLEPKDRLIYSFRLDRKC